ncbi:MAG: bifunctional (p)ppGpp synthetase/guanosine-3',5'-bis(diphosphate) 3'-pyrophosphohydrolase [Firmicutes bacterium]|nr:bifunctional (p)ppGpp synthetase/guanosine-3',5'-bis(diphosphate) 3'-pyrophosphohydrolase [Bacillota bacterium]
MEITLETLIKAIGQYNLDFWGIEKVRQAYKFAELMHDNQKRESGEPYIIHPISVALILAEMHADIDTICAGLLHDVLEDSETTKKDLEREFGNDVANLVDGVTKLKRMNFSSKEAQNLANTRKIITSISEDVRIIIIKLADRLHNMRTLHFKKSVFKQQENAVETMEIFVPLAYYIGAYRIKTELEDLSLRYTEPDKYKKMEDLKLKIEEESKECLQEMLYKIKVILNEHGITNEIKVRTKNIYGIYKNLNSGHKLSDIRDLIALKIMVDEIDECYRAIRWIHLAYHPMPKTFGDYICNPKPNMYQGLHTTLIGPEGRLAHAQIRTHDMDRVASHGIATYWDINKGDTRTIMQEALRTRTQFVDCLTEIDSNFDNNKDFVERVKKELFSDIIEVYTKDGERITLPKGATPIDFAYHIHTAVGNQAEEAFVNDERVLLNYCLNNYDRVRIVTNPNANGPTQEWLKMVCTSRARTRIKNYLKVRA